MRVALLPVQGSCIWVLSPGNVGFNFTIVGPETDQAQEVAPSGARPKRKIPKRLATLSVLAPDFPRRCFQVFEVDPVLLQRAEDIVE